MNIDSPNNSNNDNKWDCCCISLDKNCIVYFTQMFILLIVICVSLYKLIDDDQSSRDLFVSLLSSSIGYILPSPKLSK